MDHGGPARQVSGARFRERIQRHVAGDAEWDPVKEMAWAATMYAYLGKAYAYLDPVPGYRVFIRVGGRGGTALSNSFMGGARARQPGSEPKGEASRGTFTHEMGHMFVGSIEAPMGVSSWFSEGLNTYYTRLLPMRGGFTTVDDPARHRRSGSDYLQHRTQHVRRRDREGWVQRQQHRAHTYTRSSLYFADLDSRIRAHSGGKRNLDKVLFELFQRRERGERFDHDVWIKTLVAEAGPERVRISKGSSSRVPKRWCRHRMRSVRASSVAKLRPLWWTAGSGRRATSGSASRRFPTTSAVNPGEPQEVEGDEGFWRTDRMKLHVVQAWLRSGAHHATVRRSGAGSCSATAGTDRSRHATHWLLQRRNHQIHRDCRGNLHCRRGRHSRSRHDQHGLRSRRREGPRAGPVMFVFNGGPGASSSPLHMGAFGPRLRGGPGGGLRYNP